MVCVRLIHKKNTSKDCDRRDNIIMYNNDDNDDDDDDDNGDDDNGDDDNSHNTPGIFKIKRKPV